MSVPNCKGCEEDIYQALIYQAGGLYLVQQEITNLGLKGHFNIMMVDDNGKIRIS